MIYRAYIRPDTHILMVVRAATRDRAVELAEAAAREYHADNYVQALELYDPDDGPEGVLCEDAS